MSGIFSWSPFSRSKPSLESETVELRHGKQTYPLTFPPGTLAELSVSDLKLLARKEARLPDEAGIKLLFQGRRLDDKEKVSKYNVVDGSRILMTSSKKIEKPPTASENTATVTTKASATKPTPAPAPQKAVAPQTPLDKIMAIRQHIKTTYGPQINAFVQTPPSSRKERIDTKARLNELLLQQLLKFDDVVVDPDDYASKEARLERKAAIKWVQGLMEQIDGVDVDL